VASERRQRGCGRDIVWQTVPNASPSNRKGPATDCGLADGRNVKLSRRSRSQPSSLSDKNNINGMAVAVGVKLSSDGEIHW